MTEREIKSADKHNSAAPVMALGLSYLQIYTNPIRQASLIRISKEKKGRHPHYILWRAD